MSSTAQENLCTSFSFRLDGPIDLDSQNHATSVFGVLEFSDVHPAPEYVPAKSGFPAQASTRNYSHSRARRVSQNRRLTTELGGAAWTCRPQPGTVMINPAGPLYDAYAVSVLPPSDGLLSMAYSPQLPLLLRPLTRRCLDQEIPNPAYTLPSHPEILREPRRELVDRHSSCDCFEFVDVENQECRGHTRPEKSPVYMHTLLQPIGG
ncbi:hypothetical protein CVT26_006749 [Gymnopilus dilepis]|uniref:Uncharacterized protein n=1 Tax=Gymnopilus dilepis TaxID=231916 RepID=A0A409W1I6_9AGAR|nr:hypothetical protein CVT26_006749 [Gymnopilus dilepis]